MVFKYPNHYFQTKVLIYFIYRIPAWNISMIEVYWTQFSFACCTINTKAKYGETRWVLNLKELGNFKFE